MNVRVYGDEDGVYRGKEFVKPNVMEVPKLHVGMKFANIQDFRWDFRQNAIAQKRDIYFSISKSKKIQGRYREKKCSWKVYGSWNSQGIDFVLKFLSGGVYLQQC